MPRWDINRRWTPQEWFGPDVDVGGLPLGMRLSNNAFNIKWTGTPYQRRTFIGMEGPSEARDQGDPQIRFANPLSGVASGIRLGLTKQGQGLKTVRQLIAHPKLGWTPGSNAAAVNVAGTMGIDPDAPIDLRDPATAQKWSRALISQEHGESGRLYDDELIRRGVELGLAGATPAPAGATPPSPASFAGPSAMPSATFPSAPSAPLGFDLNTWVSSPLFQMGAGVLGSDNVGRGLSEGAKASQAMAMGNMKMQTLQDARTEKLRRDQIWGSVFPGGRPNAGHPLLKDVPPELQALAFARGSEQGLADLHDYQFKRASSRIALEAAEQKRNAMITTLQRLRGGQAPVPGAAGVDPTAGSTLPPAAAGPAIPSPTATAVARPRSALTTVPGTVVDEAPDERPPAAAAGLAPPTPLSPTDRRANLLDDQDAWDLVVGHLAVNDEKGAMDALVARYKAKVEEENKIAAERRAEQFKIAAERRAPAIEGAKRLEEKRGEAQAADENQAKAARTMWGYIDRLEESAKAIGDDDLWWATSPSMDTSWGSSALNPTTWFTAKAYNNRQKLLTGINAIIVQARETQRGLGPLALGEQELLEKAYAGMKNATNPQAFYDALEDARAVLAPKIPEKANYKQPWIERQQAAREKEDAAFRKQERPEALARLDAELARQRAAIFNRSEQPPAQLAAPGAPIPATFGATPDTPTEPAQVDMRPPDRSDGINTDSFTARMEGRVAYDHKTGLWGKIVDGKFLSKRELMRRNRNQALTMGGRFPTRPAPGPEPGQELQAAPEQEAARRRAEIERQSFGELARRAQYQRGRTAY